MWVFISTNDFTVCRIFWPKFARFSAILAGFSLIFDQNWQLSFIYCLADRERKGMTMAFLFINTGKILRL
jgi:hypothetical protein